MAAPPFYALIAVISIVITLVIFWLVARAIVIVGPGEEVVVYLFGRYSGTLGPGFHVINPNSRVIRAGGRNAKSSPVGAIGTVSIESGPDSLAGRVLVGDEVYVARSPTRIPAGTKVRIVSEPLVLKVVEVRSAVTPRERQSEA